MYVNDPTQKVMYYYGVYQPLIDVMEKTVSQIQLDQGLPNQSEIEEFTDGKHNILVLDDLMQQMLAHKYMDLLFTQLCHHKQLYCIYLTQFFYSRQ